jgi:hypothetical protein
MRLTLVLRRRVAASKDVPVWRDRVTLLERPSRFAFGAPQDEAVRGSGIGRGSPAARSPLPGWLGLLALFLDRRGGGAEIRPRIGDRGEARGRVAGGEIGRADLGRKLLPGERH